MRTIFLILIFFFMFGQNYAYTDPKIIKKISDTKNFAFDFEQFINDKKETGNCTILFDNKMICKYDESGKIIVSNGKTLLIRNKNSSFANTYKTENTYFKYILNKEFLISKIEGNVVEKKQNFLLSTKNYLFFISFRNSFFSQSRVSLCFALATSKSRRANRSF